MSAPHRRQRRLQLEWVAATGLAALLGVSAGTWLRAAEPETSGMEGMGLVRALGAPTGVLAVVNPVNCALTARDAAALNAIAALPGVRVTVLLLAVPPRDSLLQRIRRDFGFSSAVVVAAAARVNPEQLPDLFRMPFVALVMRGQLQHAAWGESLKSIHAWLPRLVGTSRDTSQPHSRSPAS